jgi:hypothetical protein
MNWNQIFHQSDQQDRTEQVVNFLQFIEAHQRRPVFLRNFYISPRYVKRLIPGKQVFLASAFNILSQYVNFGKNPNFAVFSMGATVVLLAMLFAIRFNRVRMEMAV